MRGVVLVTAGAAAATCPANTTHASLGRRLQGTKVKAMTTTASPLCLLLLCLLLLLLQLQLPPPTSRMPWLA